MMIRPATPSDVDALVGLIGDLATYERSAASVQIEPPQLHDALFGPDPSVFAHVAEDGGVVMGMAIWFVNFSTWTGRHGIFLEDLYVRPEARGRGIGRALVRQLARIAHSAGYARVDWSVLDWNEEARRFYRALGAVALDEWTGYRLAGTALDALARERPSTRRPQRRRSPAIGSPAQMVKARLATSFSPNSRSPATSTVPRAFGSGSSRPPVRRRNSGVGIFTSTVGAPSSLSVTEARPSTATSIVRAAGPESSMRTRDPSGMAARRPTM